MIDFVKVRKALFTEKTESTVVQLFRYTFVGGLAFIVDFGTLFILTEYLNLFYLISAGIAFILGLITNYALSVNWVFSNRTLDSKGMEFFLFTVIFISFVFKIIYCDNFSFWISYPIFFNSK